MTKKSVPTSVMTQKRAITRTESIPSFSASGGDHVGFFPAQNEHEKLDAICVIGIFCVIADKTYNEARYNF